MIYWSPTYDRAWLTELFDYKQTHELSLMAVGTCCQSKQASIFLPMTGLNCKYVAIKLLEEFDNILEEVNILLEAM